jgi:transcriptional regulator with XRE-family HTH domain
MGRPLKPQKPLTRLKKYLETQNMLQAEFATLCGVRQPTVSDWLSGKVAPSIENLKILSGVTGLTIDELLDCEPPRFPAADLRTAVGE